MMPRYKIPQPSSMETRIQARKNPKFKPTDDQIEKAGEAARKAYGAIASPFSEVTRWECAAEAALRTLDVDPPRECTCSDGQVCTVCTPYPNKSGES